MRVQFSLSWLKNAQSTRKGFKLAATHSLFHEYTSRITHFMPCKIGPYLPKGHSCIWVCEREKKGIAVSSRDLARELQKVMNSGTQELQIVIGGPDGFTMEELEVMKPFFRWSFGPLTLPHELAAIIAAEQIYRALTILKNMPYHRDH